MSSGPDVDGGTSLEDERPRWGQEVISHLMRWACPWEAAVLRRGPPGLESGSQQDSRGD